MITIVTVDYNGLADTCALLQCFTPYFKDDGKGMIGSWRAEMIVVDNGSDADEASQIARRFPWAKTIRSDANYGYAAACNMGLMSAKGSYVMLLNNDTLLDPEELPQLALRLDSDDKIGIVCPKLRYASGDCLIQYAGYTPLSSVTLRNHAIGMGKPDDGSYDDPCPTPFAHGAAMMVRRSAVDVAGMMPECYFLYYEELDWSLMMRRKGFAVWYEPACTVFHKESQSTGAQSPLHTYYLTRNRLLFAHRNVPPFSRPLSYAYLVMIVAVRDVALHLLHRRGDLAKATLRGVAAFFK